MCCTVPAIMRRARSERARATASSSPMPVTYRSAGLNLASPTPTASLSRHRSRALARVWPSRSSIETETVQFMRPSTGLSALIRCDLDSFLRCFVQRHRYGDGKDSLVVAGGDFVLVCPVRERDRAGERAVGELRASVRLLLLR